MSPEKSQAERGRDWKTFSATGRESGTEFERTARRHMPGRPEPSAIRQNRWLPPLLVLMSSVTAISFGYMLHERAHAAQLSADNQLMSASIAQMRAEVDALTAKINSLSAQSRPSTQPADETAKGGHAGSVPNASSTVLNTRQSTVHWKKVEPEVDGSPERHTSLRDSSDNDPNVAEANLEAASRDELSGSIARNHDELLVLERRGERNYFEFDVGKMDGFQRIGPLSLSLRKVDTKHQRYNLDVLAGDDRISKKGVCIYEPVLLYPENSHRPLELVVNRIGKDKVQGYVSAPKYSDSELDSKTPPEHTEPSVPPSNAQVAARTAAEESWGGKFRRLVNRLR